MADSKISALNAVSSVIGTEEIPVNNAGATEKATGTQVSQYVETRLQQGVLCSKSALQTIATGAFAELTWDVEEWKVGETAIHSTSSNTGRMVAQIAGEYLPVGAIEFDVTASDFVVAVRLRKNGAVFARIKTRSLENAGHGVGIQIPPVPVQLSATDYITAEAFHTLGSDYDVAVNYSRFGMYLLGR